MIRAIRGRLALVVAPGERERGLSLVELLVTMVIFGFLLAMTAGFMVNASRATATNKAIDSTSRTAATGINELTRVIRGAANNAVVNQTLPDPAFVTAGDNTVTLYTYINLSSTAATPVRVQFSLSGTNLVEWTWTATSAGGYYTYPSAATCSTSCTSRTIAQPVVLASAGGPNLFTYLDSTGATISTAAGTVPTAQIANIAAVKVSLQVGASSAANQSTLLTDAVGLPNLNVARTS